jgi:hypothetical protein
MINPMAYTLRTQAMTPAQRKADKIQRLQAQIQRRQASLVSEINADAPDWWFERMNRSQRADEAKLAALTR